VGFFRFSKPSLTTKSKGRSNRTANQKNTLKNELDSIEGKRITLETVKGYTATPSKLKKADSETQKYKQLYNQEYDSKSDLISQLAHQKSEAKRWEGNYNNLYRQLVQLKKK